MRCDHRRASIVSVLAVACLGLAPIAQADFVNGNFTTGDFTGWTQNAYTNPGINPSVFPGGPTTEADLNLSAGGTPQSAVEGAGSAAQTGGGLSWVGHAARVHDQTNGSNYTVSSIEQAITIAAGDVDPDGRVHIRFNAAPVLEDPSHSPEEQPYFFIQITGPGGASLFHTFNYANEAGVSWQTSGSFKFTDWQAFDVPLPQASVGVGATVKIKAIAAGCAQGGHAGAVYLRDVRTAKQVAGASLWITSTGPTQVCLGRSATYTYTYENNGSDPMTNVMVEVNLPETSDTGTAATFVSISNPTFGGGTCTAPATLGDPALCNIGTLQPGDQGTFTMTVAAPAAAAAGSTLNNGNYTISGDDPTSTLITQLGPLVRTTLDACLAAAPKFVPTLGQWGLLMLSLMLVGVGGFATRRRIF